LLLVVGLLWWLLPSAAPAAAEPRAVPTFHCMSLYWDRAADGSTTNECRVNYRAPGQSAWREAQPLWFDVEQKQYRGSVVELAPNTAYEFQLRLRSGATAFVQQRTWDEDFPVAEIITLPAGKQSTPLVLTNGGRPGAFTLYIAHPSGTEIDVANRHDHGVVIDADYVLLRGVVCKGARVHGVLVRNRHDVVIEGCDISGWGRRETRASAKPYAADLGEHLDSGIATTGTNVERLVIQGNRIHHPRYRANNWTEWSPFFKSTHPQGPKAVLLGAPTRGHHVIRYNDVYSDRDRMFNDLLLESVGAPLPSPGNGLVCDSDIYGNRLTDAWDDGLELERGDRNTRIWGNYFSDVIKCVSAGYIWEGPVYVWRNVAGRLLHPREMPGHNGGQSPFRAHPPCFLPPPQEAPAERRLGVVFVYHNTLLSPPGFEAGWAFNAWHRHRYVSTTPRLISRNNVWTTRAFSHYWNTPNPGGTNFMVRDFHPSYLDEDYDLHNGVIHLPQAAGPHAIQAAPRYRPGHGPGAAQGFQLDKGSPGHDAGALLRNFNDGYEGAAPDMGAHEFGAPDMVFGTANWRPRHRQVEAK
jgi:hypothetical protein